MVVRPLVAEVLARATVFVSRRASWVLSFLFSLISESTRAFSSSIGPEPVFDLRLRRATAMFISSNQYACLA